MYNTWGRCMSPSQKCPFPWENLEPILCLVHWAHMSPPKASRSAQPVLHRLLLFPTHRITDTCRKWLHLHSACGRCGPKSIHSVTRCSYYRPTTSLIIFFRLLYIPSCCYCLVVKSDTFSRKVTQKDELQKHEALFTSSGRNVKFTVT